MENNPEIPEEHQDLLEENLQNNNDNNENEGEAGGGNPNHPGDEIDNNPAAPAGPAEEQAAPLPDEIDAINNAAVNLPAAIPVAEYNFHQLDNALQHVQGHMDNMMQNLGNIYRVFLLDNLLQGDPIKPHVSTNSNNIGGVLMRDYVPM